MKKKILIIIGVLLFIVFLAYLTYDEKISYDKYARIKITQRVFDFDTINLNSKVNFKFNLLNVSENPFYILKLESDEKINYLNTQIKRVIDNNESTFINTQIIPVETGSYLNRIILESNSEQKIILVIKGYVK